MLATAAISLASKAVDYLIQLRARNESVPRLVARRTLVPLVPLGRAELYERATFYLDGQPLINPHVFVCEVTSRGRVLREDDFVGALTVRLEQSHLVTGTISWNRPDVLTEQSCEIIARPNELAVKPALLNPGDAVTFSCLVEAYGPDTSVFARVPGLAAIEVHDEDVAMEFRRSSQVKRDVTGSESLSLTIFHGPLLSAQRVAFAKTFERMTVDFNEVRVERPEIVISHFHNEASQPIELPGAATLWVSGDAQIVDAYLDSGEEIRSLPFENPSKLVLNLGSLRPKEMVTVVTIMSDPDYQLRLLNCERKVDCYMAGRFEGHVMTKPRRNFRSWLAGRLTYDERSSGFSDIDE